MLNQIIPVAMNSFIIPALIGGGIALVLGIVIIITTKVFALPVDERLEKTRGILPGVNCGACGYSGCDGYAAALSSGADTDASRCPVGGTETAAELAEFLDLAQPSFVPKVAHVYCQGTSDHTKKRFAYSGTISCSAAHGLFSGPNSCTYGCIGFGDCADVCPYGAIYLAGSIAHVDSSLCTACGLCVKACPKELIEVIPKHLDAYTVKCRNKWPGAQTRKNCTIGCIGCQRCFKTCQYGAITMDGPLAVIDQEKCVRCGECLDVCPTGAIMNGLMLAADDDGHPTASGLHHWTDPREAAKAKAAQAAKAK